MDKLPEWVEQKLTEKNWRPADLARVSGLPDATISRILNRMANAGVDACLAIARAFNEPEEKVFRLAGLLPPLPGPEDEVSIREVVELLRRLEPDRRKDVLSYAFWRFQQQERNRDTVSNRSNGSDKKT